MPFKLQKFKLMICKVSKGAKIRNGYNQVPHLTQDTNEKVTNSQLDTTNESQEVSPFPDTLTNRENPYIIAAFIRVSLFSKTKLSSEK